jgi:hypothetical protein
MKMTDVYEGAMDDFGLRGHGAELDKDIDPNAKRYNNDLVTVQASKLADYPDGGEIETNDGEMIKVSQQEAKFIRQVPMKNLAGLFNVKYAMMRDPEADDAIQTKLQDSEGLNLLLRALRKK